MHPATSATEAETADAAFWGSSYRSGGSDWREFLEIDGDHDDAEFTAAFAAAPVTGPEWTEGAPEAAAEFAPAVDAPAVDAPPAFGPEESTPAESDGFGSWTAALDDFLPSR